jgi:hypothetical protein
MGTSLASVLLCQSMRRDAAKAATIAEILAVAPRDVGEGSWFPATSAVQWDWP